MSLCSWVNVVVGKMTAIDRAAKQVIVSREEVVPYDHLILCTGQQYQVSPRGWRGSRADQAHVSGSRACLPPAHVTGIGSKTLLETHSKKFCSRIRITASWRNVILKAVVQKSNTYCSPEQNPDAARRASVEN